MPPMKQKNEFRRKILGCWLGKSVGGILGTPYESDPRTHELIWYDPVPDGMLPNDDIELQVMYLYGLARMAHPAVNREILAGLWPKHMNFHVQEYAVALCNLRRGLRPPWSGRYDNPFSDGMGAAIRSELWACLAPGNPELAAAYAREDACIDHDGEGVHAEVFLAALESMAFVEADLRKLISAALEFVPPRCGIARQVAETCRIWDESGDWKQIRNHLCEKGATEFVSCVLPNVPLTVLALLAGGGDFGRTICTAVNCGMDTDCTAATAGAIRGILAPESISEEWLAPVGRTVAVRPECCPGVKAPETLDRLTDEILALGERLGEFREPPPEPEPDWSCYAIPARIGVRSEREWWQIPLRGDRVKWEEITLPGMYGRIDLSHFGEPRQVLLRVEFHVKSDGYRHIMFNSPTTNHVYLDPDWTRAAPLHDAKDMLFGRTRPFLGPEPAGNFPGKTALSCQIFNPHIAGAPLNQIARNRFLRAGRHELLISLVPCAGEHQVRYCLGIGAPENSALLPDVFQPTPQLQGEIV